MNGSGCWVIEIVYNDILFENFFCLGFEKGRFDNCCYYCIFWIFNGKVLSDKYRRGEDKSKKGSGRGWEVEGGGGRVGVGVNR